MLQHGALLFLACFVTTHVAGMQILQTEDKHLTEVVVTAHGSTENAPAEVVLTAHGSTESSLLLQDGEAEAAKHALSASGSLQSLTRREDEADHQSRVADDRREGAKADFDSDLRLRLAMDGNSYTSPEGSSCTLHGTSDTTGTTGTNSGPTFSADRFGANSALSFDGIDDYATCSAPGLHLGRGSTTEWTVAFWMKMTSCNEAYLVAKHPECCQDSLYHDYVVKTDPSGSYCQLTWGTGDDSDACAHQRIFSSGLVGEWVHFVGVLAATGSQTGSKKVYINGASSGSCTYSKKGTGCEGATCPAGDDLFVGRFPYELGADYFAGQLDDIRIYSRALTAADVEALYNAPPYSYVDAPKVSEDAISSQCSSWTGTLEEAQALCSPDEACTLLEDIGCDNVDWRCCDVSKEELQAAIAAGSGTGNGACVKVQEITDTTTTTTTTQVDSDTVLRSDSQLPGARNCLWGDWSPWSACSDPCGGGEKNRTRLRAVTPSLGGDECEGPHDGYTDCNMDDCPPQDGGTTTTAEYGGTKKQEEDAAAETQNGQSNTGLYVGIALGVVVVAGGVGAFGYQQMQAKSSKPEVDEFGVADNIYDDGNADTSYDDF